ncbi:MAG: DUF2760 domain-containing protein [Gammaproteobacteria bacterium]|nr:DUF2760 domain-containing protein [Gammaproteobacteria bacterium]
MNVDINALLSNLDVLHYSFAGLNAVLFILVVLLLSRKKRTPAANEKQAEIKTEALSADKAPEPAKFLENSPKSALQLLGLLQQEARFIDFLEEDAQSFSDAEVGAAARVIHEGARKVLHDNFTISSVRSEIEGERVTLESGFNNNEVRLSGNVVGNAPFSGQLVHRGWRVSEVKLPKVTAEHDLSVIAPAEVEI